MSFFNRFRKTISPKTKPHTESSRKNQSDDVANINSRLTLFNYQGRNDGKVKESGKMAGSNQLQRSDTFILKEGIPDKLVICEDVEIKPRKVKSGSSALDYGSSTIKTDVFEPLYSNRLYKPPKTSSYESCKEYGVNAVVAQKSTDNCFAAYDAIYNQPRNVSTNVTVAKYSQHSPDKPSEYHFGTMKSPSKEQSDQSDQDRFKTITKRRGASNELKEIADSDRYYNTIYMEFNAPTKKNAIDRKHTFKIHGRHSKNNADKESTGRKSLNRTETFKIDVPHKTSPISTSSYLNNSRQQSTPIRVEMLTVSDRKGKIVPIGIATPYNCRNDKPTTDRHISRLRDIEPTEINSTFYNTGHAQSGNNKVISGASKKYTQFGKNFDYSSKMNPGIKIKPQIGGSSPRNPNIINSDSRISRNKLYDSNYVTQQNHSSEYRTKELGHKDINVRPKSRETYTGLNPNNWLYNKVHI